MPFDSDTRPPATGSAQSASCLTWSTPLRVDPSLVERLSAIEREMLAAFDECVAAVLARSAADATCAAARCGRLLRELHREEALGLYPVVSRRCGDDAVRQSELNGWRLYLHEIGRRFLRLLDGLAESSALGCFPEANLVLATSVLQRYCVEKRTTVYARYVLECS